MIGGSGRCWGSNDGARVKGQGSIDNLIPVDIPGLLSGLTTVAVGTGHACALTSEGLVKCWGGNDLGQLGNGSTTGGRVAVPVDVSGLSGEVTDLAAGGYHTCVLIGGQVECWGNNANGRLGDGSMTDSRFPVVVSGLTSGVLSIAAGNSHTCALMSTGEVKCWGSNFQGQLGDGSTIDSIIPVDVPGLVGATAIAAGGAHTCALTIGNGVKCWGWNQWGQLGNGTTVDSTGSVDVLGLGQASGITAGGRHTCALLSGGGAACWGYNSGGRLGNGTTTNSNNPVEVSGLASGVTAIAAGHAHTCALISDGGVKCWGVNDSGQLGTGATTSSYVPVDVRFAQARPSS